MVVKQLSELKKGDKGKIKMEAYCFRCRLKQGMQNLQHMTLKNERPGAGYLPSMWLQDVQNGKEQIDLRREVIDGRETAQRVKER